VERNSGRGVCALKEGNEYGRKGIWTREWRKLLFFSVTVPALNVEEIHIFFSFSKQKKKMTEIGAAFAGDRENHLLPHFPTRLPPERAGAKEMGRLWDKDLRIVWCNGRWGEGGGEMVVMAT